MKKILLGGNFYKTNLHCHTDFSDGRLSPRQVKEEYKKRGYSAVAFTDHDIFICHDELADEAFVPLHGYEAEICDSASQKCCHICYIAYDENKTEPICLHRHGYMFANAPSHASEVKFGNMVDYHRSYTPECVNEMIKMGHDAGFFISYNHPTWSIESFEEYGKYEGMDALEILNGDCIAMGYDDDNSHAYSDLLRQGKMIACTGSDDNHDVYPIGHPLNDSFTAWTMINAAELSYSALAKGLKEKAFYASAGPVIKELYAENGKLFIETEPCREIIFDTDVRYAKRFYEGDDKQITSAVFDVTENVRYVRVTVIDKSGRKAYTRAYAAEELLK